MKTHSMLLALVVSCSTAWAVAPVEQDLFVSGEEGYNTFRIPSVIATKKGTLLAFCEGRVKNRSDAGNIDLVFRRSTDGGKTWSKLEKLWDDGEHTCGNPCPVVDQETGTIWLLLTWNAGKVSEAAIQPGFGEDSRRVFVSSSTDDGKTWSSPEEITSKVKKPEWSWYATGPGCGIQLARGKHKGRLVIPCDHKVPMPGKKEPLGYSHVIYSDDHGQSWQLGGATPTGNCNECEVVELEGGRLLLNMRNHVRTVKNRQISTSDDGGMSWSKPEPDSTLIEPVCQASIRRYRWPAEGKPGVFLFSNPASTKGREQLTIRASYDDAKTWRDAKVLYARSSAYSCLAVLPDGRIACLYERDSYGKITLATFPLEWVSEPTAGPKE